MIKKSCAVLFISLLLTFFCFAGMDTTIVLSHPAPTRHWAEFLTQLEGEGEYRVLAAEEGAKELSKRGIPFTYFYQGEKGIKTLSEKEANALVKKVARMCRKSKRVIFDFGYSFAAKVEERLAVIAPNVEIVVYYDNPEPYVPGGYSEEIAKQIDRAHTVLFASKSLVTQPIYRRPNVAIDFSDKRKIGIGYYPLEEVEKVKKMRAEGRLRLREAFFAKHGLKDEGQKLAVYYGGANEEYYERAFPAFCQIVSSSQLEALFIIQQHPRARTDGNRDIKLLPTDDRFVVSQETDSDAMLALAAVVLYYQTSASPKFALSGTPAIQIGHEPFVDIVVASGIVPSVTDSDGLMRAFQSLTPSENTKEIEDKVGIDRQWLQNLEKFLITQ